MDVSHAPELSELGPATSQIHSNNEQKFPSVQLVGCGGAGINLVKEFLKGNYQFDEPVKVSVMDTSLSNVNGLDQRIEFHSIEGLGSGKDRTRNFNSIKEYLDTETEVSKGAADISVICFASGGGSGSVIAPLLASKILKNSNKGVLLICILDQSSERDCINSINTLKTLSGVAAEHKMYFPVILYDNKNAGRFIINKAAVRRIRQFIDLMTSRSIEEYDYSDRMNFIRPTMQKSAPGLYLFCIQDENDPDNEQNSKGEVNVKLKPNSRVHALTKVDNIGEMPGLLSEVSYFGYSENKNFLAVNGISIPNELLQQLKEKLDQYRDSNTAVDTTASSLTTDDNKEPNAGFVL